MTTRTSSGVILIILFSLFLSGCNPDYGKEIIYGKIHFFYTPSVAEKEAENIGNWFSSSNMVSGTEQYIQLTRFEGIFELRCICDKDAYLKTQNSMTIEEKHTQWDGLTEIPTKISKFVLNGELVNMVICDKYLKEIERIPMNDKAMYR